VTGAASPSPRTAALRPHGPAKRLLSVLGLQLGELSLPHLGPACSAFGLGLLPGLGRLVIKLASPLGGLGPSPLQLGELGPAQACRCRRR
jgi:hypothetical protein